MTAIAGGATARGGPARKHWIAIVVPFVVGLTWLALEGLGVDSGGVLALVVSAALALLLGIWAAGSTVWIARGLDGETRRRRIETALLLPCAFAPLGVLGPWVVAPSHLGIGLGNFGFFLHWLTRYPNLGPINEEVLLGIGAVLGASAMPSFLAAHLWLTRLPRARTTAVLAALHVVAYLPVLLRLDLELFEYGALVARQGPVSILTSEATPSVGSALLAGGVVGGSLLRLVTTLCALALAGLRWTRAAPPQ